jgi:hypothetical protein
MLIGLVTHKSVTRPAAGWQFERCIRGNVVSTQNPGWINLSVSHFIRFQIPMHLISVLNLKFFLDIDKCVYL